MKKNQFKTVSKFKEFVYEPGEGHFFYFCETHRNILERKQDAVCEAKVVSFLRLPTCDYPKCSNKATYEFFPNLVTVIKSTKKSELIEWKRNR